MWQTQPLESHVESRLKADHIDFDTIWSKYIATRENLISSIFPYIATKEPNLTDHGVDHIANVISNAGKLLVHSGSIGSIESQSPISLFSSKELLLLLVGCLLHDVGNIAGRKGHADSGAEVWRKAGESYNLWSPQDRRTIIAVCRAHTGTAPNGSKDTLEHLALAHNYFLKESTRAAEVAAVLRFADELAEGPQRTSHYLLSSGLYSSESLPFHQYGASTSVVIDLAVGRVALTYDIDLEANLFKPRDKSRDKLKSFIDLIYGRILKLEHERVFARHYAPNFIRFRETSVALHFHRNGEPVDKVLRPLILNDFNARGNDLEIISQVDSSYDVRSIVESVMP